MWMSVVPIFYVGTPGLVLYCIGGNPGCATPVQYTFFFKLMRYSIPVPLVAYYAFPMANHKIANDSRLAVSIQNNKMYRFTNIQWWIHKLSGQGEALLFLFAEWNLFFREENKTCTTNSNSPSYVRETILPKCARASTDGQTDRQGDSSIPPNFVAGV